MNFKKTKLGMLISRITKGYDFIDEVDYDRAFIRREYKPFMAFYNHVMKHQIGYPSEFKNIEEWNEVLEKIKFSLEWMNGKYEDGFNNIEAWREGHEKAQEGLELYGKYLTNFWC